MKWIVWGWVVSSVLVLSIGQASAQEQTCYITLFQFFIDEHKVEKSKRPVEDFVSDAAWALSMTLPLQREEDAIEIIPSENYGVSVRPKGKRKQQVEGARECFDIAKHLATLEANADPLSYFRWKADDQQGRLNFFSTDAEFDEAEVSLEHRVFPQGTPSYVCVLDRINIEKTGGTLVEWKQQTEQKYQKKYKKIVSNLEQCQAYIQASMLDWYERWLPKAKEITQDDVVFLDQGERARSPLQGLYYFQGYKKFSVQ